MDAVPLRQYLDLMGEFASRRLSGADFETQYLSLFKQDDTRRAPLVFDVLDRIFGDVDAFSADPALRGEDGLDEAALRSRVAAALRELEALEA